MTISVVINTLNAEKYLDECLGSINYFDEIVICDMHNDDKTIEIAEKYNFQFGNIIKILNQENNLNEKKNR